MQDGSISTGNVGDGAKAWGGVGRASHVPVQSAYNIALLVQGGRELREFTGFRVGAPPLTPAMERFFALLGEHAPHTLPPLIC